MMADEPKHTTFFTFFGSSVRANSLILPFTLPRNAPAPTMRMSTSSVNGVATLSAFTHAISPATLAIFAEWPNLL